MTKLRKKPGAPYEDAVCDLFRRFSPAATINAGVWVKGPDGRRELDVHIVEKQASRTVHGIVECKDFNPATTGPVGIAYIDALDSKRRDLGLEFAFVCSNAGFSDDAIRKAKRVDIGLLGATRKDDSRIRFGVVDEIYMRHIRLTVPPLAHYLPADGESPPSKEMLESGEPHFEGRPVAPWLYSRFLHMIGVNPIVAGSLLDQCRFKNPIRLDWPAGSAMIQQIGLETSIEGAWFAQSVQLDSTAGLYDWLRRCMRLAPSPQPQQFQVVGVDYYGGKWIAQPPDVDWANRKLLPYETEMKFVAFKNSFVLENPALLYPHVVPEDLKFVIENLDESVTKSVVGFTPDRVPDSEVGKQLWPGIKAQS
jgi:hypothetical protein